MAVHEPGFESDFRASPRLLEPNLRESQVVSFTEGPVLTVRILPVEKARECARRDDVFDRGRASDPAIRPHGYERQKDKRESDPLDAAPRQSVECECGERPQERSFRQRGRELPGRNRRSIGRRFRWSVDARRARNQPDRNLPRSPRIERRHDRENSQHYSDRENEARSVGRVAKAVEGKSGQDREREHDRDSKLLRIAERNGGRIASPRFWQEARTHRKQQRDGNQNAREPRAGSAPPSAHQCDQAECAAIERREEADRLRMESGPTPYPRALEVPRRTEGKRDDERSEEHTSELQ